MKIADRSPASVPNRSQNRWSVEGATDPRWHPCSSDILRATAAEPGGAASAAGTPVVSRAHGRNEPLGCHRPR